MAEPVAENKAPWDVKGKVFFITGGNKGLGRGYGMKLLKHGAKVFLTGTDLEAAKETTDKYEKAGFKADDYKFKAFDITDKKEFQDAFDEAVKVFGQVDVMVNNAGIANESKYDKMIEINCNALVHGTHIAQEHMRKDKENPGKGGRIINIASIASVNKFPVCPIYCATKTFVRAFTQSMSQQPAAETQGIEYAVIAPNAAKTDIITKMTAENLAFLDDQTKETIRNMMHPQIVVEAFYTLVTAEKMNGKVILVLNEKACYIDAVWNTLEVARHTTGEEEKEDA